MEGHALSCPFSLDNQIPKDREPDHGWANYCSANSRRRAADASGHEFSHLGLSWVGDYIFSLRGRRWNCSALEHSLLR
jgi:hypothetical protein